LVSSSPFIEHVSSHSSTIQASWDGSGNETNTELDSVLASGFIVVMMWILLFNPMTTILTIPSFITNVAVVTERKHATLSMANATPTPTTQFVHTVTTFVNRSHDSTVTISKRNVIAASDHNGHYDTKNNHNELSVIREQSSSGDSRLLKCHRPCPPNLYKTNRIIYQRPVKAGLLDRLTILESSSNLAQYMCATLVVFPPHLWLAVDRHNDGVELSPTLTWSNDFMTYESVPAASRRVSAIVEESQRRRILSPPDRTKNAPATNRTLLQP
jgi:hypothetical protein